MPRTGSRRVAAGLSLLVLVLALAAVLVQVRTYEPLRSITGYRPLIVLGGSMAPAIPVGGLVFVREIGPDEVRVGDIITFRTPVIPDAPEGGQASLTTHRVTGRAATETGAIAFTTQGDANSSPDGWMVTADHLLGKAGFSVPYFGYLAHFARTPLGFVLLVVVPAVLLIATEIRNIYRQRSRKDTEATGGHGAAGGSKRGAVLAVVVLLGLLAAVGASTRAHFSAQASTDPAHFSALSFGDLFIVSPGTAKATRTSGPRPGESASFNVATVNEAGELELDFGEVSQGSGKNFPSTFSITNTSDRNLLVSLQPQGDIAPVIDRVRIANSGSPYELKPGETARVDVRVSVSATASPGEYIGSFRVESLDGFLSRDIPAAVTVRGRGR